MKINHALSSLSLLGLLACASAFAADAPAGHQSGPVADACRHDVETLCPGVQPGDGRIKACMRKNRDKVSEGCKAALKEHRAEKKAANK